MKHVEKKALAQAEGELFTEIANRLLSDPQGDRALLFS